MPDTAPDRDDASTQQKVHKLLSDWRVWLSESLDQVETFTKEKPSSGLALSFLTGFLLGSIFRRK